MSGPVWRFESALRGACDVCLSEVTGLFIEGEIDDGTLAPGRKVCPACVADRNELVVTGELGKQIAGPAYGHGR